MNNNFGLYSKYYDLLYKDKDYPAEVKYIKDLLAEFSPSSVRAILELGSGTGIHASMLAASVPEVFGVELSPSMLEVAKARVSQTNRRLDFSQGDARTFRMTKKFDAVISLFHVASYQVTDHDFYSMIETAAEHLNPGGIFIFDYWFGPAVLWQRPGLRIKRLADSTLAITRIAEPEVKELSNSVDVNYTIYVTNQQSKEISLIEECHHMRYFFPEEISRTLQKAGFELVSSQEWLTGAEPSRDTWGVCSVARKLPS